MTDIEKLNKIKSTIEKSGLTGGKVSIDYVIKEMEKVSFIEVAEIIVEMGTLIKNIKDITEF